MYKDCCFKEHFSLKTKTFKLNLNRQKRQNMEEHFQIENVFYKFMNNIIILMRIMF